MYQPYMHGMFGISPFGAALGTGFAVLTIIVLLWELFWKGLALWHAARNGQWIWFIVFLLVHTAGILEIVYLIWFRSNKNVPLFPFGPTPAPVGATTPVTIIEETIIVESSDDSGVV